MAATIRPDRSSSGKGGMTMHRVIAGLVIASLAWSVSPARAADGVSGEVSLGAAVSGKDEQAQKFREYWYNMRSGFSVAPAARVRYSAALGDVPVYGEVVLNGRSGLVH